jgi:thiol-disulfide isomerase/thioredoxin
MKKLLMRMFNKIVLALLILFIGLSVEIKGQKVEYIKIPDLEKILSSADNKLFVLNFWATWCGPCVSEMPGFEKVAKDYNSEKVKFILVSLDFPSQIQQQLIPFLKKNNITLEVAVMTDLDYNKWIDKVDTHWQGDIPATLFFNNPRKTRYFHSGELAEPELRKYINSFL